MYKFIWYEKIVGRATFVYTSQQLSPNPENTYYNCLENNFILNEFQNNDSNELITLNTIINFVSTNENARLKLGGLYKSILTSNTLKINNGKSKIKLNKNTGQRYITLKYELKK